MANLSRWVVSYFCGFIFGLGLTVSNMINPSKVLAFLDITGAWDPSLLVVMLAAVGVTFLGYRCILKSPQPLYDKQFHLPTKAKIDKSLVIGAALFGIGWGMAGYCPGPAFSALALKTMEPIYFIIGMILGEMIWFSLRR